MLPFEVALRIAGGRLLDPARGVDMHADLCIDDGIIRGVDLPAVPEERVIDASGCIVAPGFVDVHTHLREPGQSHKETVASGTAAAAAGGFTTVCAMANTDPVIDSPERVQWLLQQAHANARVRVLPVAAVTVGLSGREPTEYARLMAAGARAFSDDGHPILDEGILEHALVQVGGAGAVISLHAEDTTRGEPGIDVRVAPAVGCRGIAPEAEIDLVNLHLSTLERAGAGRLHFAHVTTAGAVDAVRDAKKRGLAVTAEATPHHLALTYDAVRTPRYGLRGDPYAKVNPPLRSEVDRVALVIGLADGTIDAVATDHAPHAIYEKVAALGSAPSGLTGLELAVPMLLSLVRDGALDLHRMVTALTSGPSNAFGLPCGSLAPGALADITVVDPDREWVVGPSTLQSMGKNTPLVGSVARGRAILTLVAGRIVHPESGSVRTLLGDRLVATRTAVQGA